MASHRLYAPNARRGFTLVELMVVLVIISILSALTLAGLAGARQRAKIDKTKSTIRKIHEIVIPQYDSYLTARLPNSIFTSTTSGSQRAFDKLVAVRSLVVFEMPDSWGDIAVSGTTPLGMLDSGTTVPLYVWARGTARRYGSFRSTLAPSATTEYGNAECLYLTVCRSGANADAVEVFRTDEIGDVDTDRAPEFLDGWGRPIRFIRWAPGFTPLSLIQSASSADPFDPMGVSGPPKDYGLVPLIFSSGPDGAIATTGTQGYGITGPPAGGWSQLVKVSGTSSTTNPPGVSPLPGAPTAGTSESTDNITNHDLMSKR